MTQVPQPPPLPGNAPTSAAQPPAGDAPAPAFVPILPRPAPPQSSRTPLIIFGVCVVALIVGVIISGTRPEAAEAKAAKPVTEMTADELAEDASMPAARELVRRMCDGTPAEHADASRVMTSPRSPRLARNLAMAMALAQQKRANEMRLRVEREQRMMMEGR